MRLFTYGTLMDPDVREIVLGMRRFRRSAFPAALHGYRRLLVRDDCYPLLVRRPYQWVDGVVIDDLDVWAAARAAYFESDEYEAHWTRVHRMDAGHSVGAWVFLPRRGVPVYPTGWDLDTWRRRHKRRFLRHCRIWMSKFPARAFSLPHPELRRGGRPKVTTPIRD